MNPVLYIHLEEGARRFTLRKTVLTSSGKADTLHVMLLTSKMETSLKEAYKYAKENGLELKHDPNRCTYPLDLDAVVEEKRSARNAKKQAKLDQQAAVDRARQERREASERSLDNGVFPFGKYQGQSFAEVPDYLAWMVAKKSEFEKGSLLEYAANVIEAKYSHLLPKKEEYADGYRPEKEKSRIMIKGKVVRSMAFSSDYGITYWVFIKDENGLCIVAKGSWYAEKGADVNITATIKTKEIYKGQAQTIVNRVKGA